MFGTKGRDTKLKIWKINFDDQNIDKINVIRFVIIVHTFIYLLSVGRFIQSVMDRQV